MATTGRPPRRPSRSRPACDSTVLSGNPGMSPYGTSTASEISRARPPRPVPRMTATSGTSGVRPRTTDAAVWTRSYSDIVDTEATVTPGSPCVRSATALPEQHSPDPDHRRAFLDGHRKIPRHPHRELRQGVSRALGGVPQLAQLPKGA